MQFITLPSLAFLALSLFSSLAAANGDFAATCNSYGIYTEGSGSWALIGNCEEEGNGTWNVDAALQVDSCFTNNNGQIAYQINGGMSASCRNGYNSGTIMYADCYNDAGVLVATSIDMNNYVGNDNGNFAC